MATGLGELLLAALALKALTGGSAQTPPPPPTEPDQAGGGAGGGGGDNTNAIASAAGTGAAALIGAIAKAAGGSSTATTGTVAAAGTTTAATGTTVGTAVGVGTFTITAGGVFMMAWAAFYILQFIIIDLLNTSRTGWLRYRDQFFDATKPLLHLHELELLLVRRAVQDLGLPPAAETPVADERLTESTITSQGMSNLTTGWKHDRIIMSNPFPTGGRSSWTAETKWMFLQMAARLVAARYCFELNRFALGMLNGFPGLGGPYGSSGGNVATEIWSYELVGGGKPTMTYAAFADQLRQVQAQGGGYTVDDMLNAARLAAMLHVASFVAQDPGINVPWDPARYAMQMYTAMGLSREKHAVTLAGKIWEIDPAFYKVPCKRLWLDIDEVKRGLRMRPFVDGTNMPNPYHLTALRASI